MACGEMGPRRGRRGGQVAGGIHRRLDERKGINTGVSFMKVKHYCSCLPVTTTPWPAMTTFTRISEEETPSIDVDVSHLLSKINPDIYGGFME
jgi:hypothetical protein